MRDIGSPQNRPSSEASYTARGTALSTVYPMNGGACDASGIWQQYGSLCDNPFAQQLKQVAHERGQSYMPTVWAVDRDQFQAMLDDPVSRDASIDGLMTLALEREFDGPWDGVDFDVEGVLNEYRDKLTDWFSDVEERLHLNGLLMNITATAANRDSGINHYRHAFDFAALSEIADSVTVMLYSTFDIEPHTSPGAYDLSDSVLAYINGKRTGDAALYAGLPVTSSVNEIFTTYANALAVLAGAGIEPYWYAANDDEVRFEFWRATWNGQEVWLINRDVLQVHGGLAEKHELDGICLFVPGSEDKYVWVCVDQWRVGMATMKLVDSVWLNQEAVKVEGVLRQRLGGGDGKAGEDASDLKAIVNYAGLSYDDLDLIDIRDKLVVDGVIELVQ